MLAVWLVALVVATRLLSTVSTSQLTEFFWQLYSNWSRSAKTRELRDKRKLLLDIRTERANTSSKDEFAKWARLDRKHQKLKAEVDALNQQLGLKRQNLTAGLRVAKWLATTGVKIYVQWRYRTAAVVWLPPMSVPYVVEWFVALPSAPTGAISVATWLLAVDATVSLVLRIAVPNSTS